MLSLLLVMLLQEHYFMQPAAMRPWVSLPQWNAAHWLAGSKEAFLIFSPQVVCFFSRDRLN